MGLTILFEISVNTPSGSKIRVFNKKEGDMNGGIQLEAKHVNLFLKQLSRAGRFERNQELNDVISKMVTRFSRLNDGLPKEHVVREKVTVILNAVNEITDLKVLLDDLNTKPKWTKSARIKLGLTRPVMEKYSLLIKEVQSKLPNFKTIILPHESLVKTLNKLVMESSTKYVLMTKKILKIDQTFDIDSFLEPIARKDSDVVSGSIYYPDGLWGTGCYQSKLIWSQYKTQYGFDVSFKQKSLLCDYFDGPFATNRKDLLEYLTARESTNCPDVLVYPEIQFVMSNQNKIIKSHPTSVFHMAEWRDLESLTRQHWLQFAIRNKISEVYHASLIGDKEKHLEFNFRETKADCKHTKAMLRQRACMRDLHLMLVNTYKLFDRLGYQYTNEDGSGLAAAKLHDTLPWDYDQDFAFRANNLTHIAKQQGEWKKLGMYFAPDINKACVRDIKHTKDNKVLPCGFIAIRDQNWFMELWGQYILVGDFYQPWKLPKEKLSKLHEPLLSSRITGNDTKVRLDDHWAQNRPNPGYYVRARYGVDMLRHAKHWRYGGASGSMSIYKTGPRFEACTKEGYHLCMNQYLADGNIQFQRPWA